MNFLCFAIMQAHMKRIQIIKIFGTVMVVGLIIAINGCKKDKHTIATITVVNEDGEPVPGASVQLYAVPSETPPPPNAIRLDRKSVV